MEATLKKKYVLTKVDEIPVFSPIVSRLINLLGDPRANTKDIIKLVSMDQGLAIRILHLANSAYYGFRKEIDTIHRAIVVLGFNAIVSLSISSSTGSMFIKKEAHNKLSAKDIWAHSMGSAICAKLIAKVTGLFDEEAAFIAALFHDFGKLLESYYLQEELDEVFKLIEQKEISFGDAEEEVLGIGHSELAASLFDKWGFPESISKGVLNHHSPNKSKELDTHIISSIVNFADFIANEEGYKCYEGVQHYEVDQETVAFLDCSEKQIEQLHVDCRNKLEDAKQMLQLSSFA